MRSRGCRRRERGNRRAGLHELPARPALSSRRAKSSDRSDENFGKSDGGSGEPVNVEFVSANPTGPLHVGHGRQAALGDAIATLLEWDRWNVSREFYYNDPRRADREPRRERCRREYASLTGDEVDDPRRGDITANTSEEIAEAVSSPNRSGSADDVTKVKGFCRCCAARRAGPRSPGLRREVRQLFPRSHRCTPMERSKTPSRALDCCRRWTYESDGALWLRTSQFGDDKDRVMRKARRPRTRLPCPVSRITSRSGSAAFIARTTCGT